jgi:hypothetical protein
MIFLEISIQLSNQNTDKYRFLKLKSSANLISTLEVLCTLMAPYLYSHDAAGVTYPRALVEILALGPRGVRFVPAVANAPVKRNA